MKLWMAVRGRGITDPSPDAFLMPDDWLYAAMLSAWIALVAVVTYVLLGWASAAALLVVAALSALGMVAIQSRSSRRQNRA
jgi:ABC-type transport system involved in cytochrome bd biosynthesis fused ATPase/permease subunit